MNHVSLNGKMLPAGKPVLLADNRGYRYGDGLFETMKLVDGRLILEKYHFERLISGLKLMQFKIPPVFTSARLRKEILALCKKDGCLKLARVRLSVFRGNGGLYDETKGPEYLIECWPINASFNQLNKKGLNVDIYPHAQKSCDLFCNLKSANYLPYVMAAQYAKANKLNDCLINNVKGHIADATIANIFMVKGNLVITPSLSEACVNGVMRRYLIEKLRASSDFDLREGVVTKNDLETFDEVFLTNAVHGIRWVKSFRNRVYTNTQTTQLYRDFIAPLYS